MATPGHAPILAPLELSSNGGGFATQELLEAMLNACGQISDLIFSPGRVPQVQVHGQLLTLQGPEVRPLHADDTRRIASDLIGNNKGAITLLREQGSCDVSYAIAGRARFRVNVFIQRGSCAVIMRVIPSSLPSLRSLGLPSQLSDIASLSEGIVLVAGPRGSGKSSTLAALLDRINEERTCHVITVEDPIEFLHNHKRATVHQRELHSDTPSFSQGLRAALRQGPHVILVGEILDRETMELVLDAAETGHLILSSINAVDGSKTIARIVSSFSAPEQSTIRGRLAKTLRYVISQKLIPRKDGVGRIAAVEILKVTPSNMRQIEWENLTQQDCLDLIRNGRHEGMQTFEDDINRLVADGLIHHETALAYTADSTALRK